MHASALLEAALRLSYGTLVSALVRNLARVAERGSSRISARAAR